jgi:hypothetical protein
MADSRRLACLEGPAKGMARPQHGWLSLVASCRKPFGGPVVLNVSGIEQGNQNIDIKQEPGHGSSSRSWRTNSEVTRGAPLRYFDEWHAISSLGLGFPRTQRLSPQGRDYFAHRFLLDRSHFLGCTQHVVVDLQEWSA